MNRHKTFQHLESLLLCFTLSFYMCFMPVMCALCLQYVKSNKEADNNWFRLESNKEGTVCVCVCVCRSVCGYLWQSAIHTYIHSFLELVANCWVVRQFM